MSSPQARPTFSCLAQLSLTPSSIPFSDLEHPVVEKARHVVRTPAAERERISGTGSVVAYKVKVAAGDGRYWRAALVEDHADPELFWIVAAGLRREGDGDDFYEWFPPRASEFAPTEKDQRRLQAEWAQALLRELPDAVADLVTEALSTSMPQEATISEAQVRIVVSVVAEMGELVVGIRPVDPRRQVSSRSYEMILASCPGVDRSTWQPRGAFPDCESHGYAMNSSALLAD